MITFTVPSPHDVVYRLCQDGDDFVQLAVWMTARRSETLGLDTETNAKDPWEPGFAVRLIQISDGNEVWMCEPSNWIKDLIHAHPRFVAHFSEAEVRFLGMGLPGALRLGELEPHVIDYQVIQAIMEPRTLLPRKDGVDVRLVLDKGLKASYERHVSPCLREAEQAMHAWFKANAPVNHRTPTASVQWGFANIPITDVKYLTYSGMDAVAVKRLYDDAMVWLHVPKRDLLREEVDRELLMQWDIDNMTFRGQPVDPPYVRWLAHELDVIIATEGFLLKSRYDIPPSGSGGKVAAAFENLAVEPLKLSKKTSKPSWDKDVLADLVNPANGYTAEVVALAKSLLAVRRAGKFRVTYVQPMIDSLSRDCRIHCSFRSIGTVTHRNSASDPPLQQQPKKDARVRAAFGGVPGWVWVTCDLEQGEPRVMAGVSGDPAFVAAVQTGDVNNAIAIDVNGAAFVPADGKHAGTDSYLMRQLAKMGLLAICYGVGLPKLASQFGITVDAAAQFRTRILTAYAVMFARGARLNTLDVVTLPSGREIILWDRKIYLPNGDIVTSGRPSRKALNYETQGHQADWLKGAWLQLRPAWNWALTFLLHDEIALFVPEALAQQAAAALKEAMEGSIGHGVQMLASAEIVGPTWLPQPDTFDRSELESVDA